MIVGIIPCVLLCNDALEMKGTRSFVITGAINKKAVINPNIFAVSIKLTLPFTTKS